MPVITVKTFIDAPVDRVFDLSTSVDLHILSTGTTHETAVAGRTSGLLQLGETVTWRAKHLGFYQRLTIRITEWQRPHTFTDEMVAGIFSMMTHHHSFEAANSCKTIMTDRFEYKSPFGLLGKLADILFLKNYMRKFLVIRNAAIKRIAEGNEWRTFLSNK